MAEPILRLQHVDFRYNRELVIDDISLDVHRGEFLGVIGPNGSGKTTLLKIIIGLLQPTKGKVSLFGTPQNKFKDWWRIGYVPQKAGSQLYQFPLTVSEVVSMGLIGRHTHAHHIAKALSDVDLTGFEKRQIGELSGGQQQRVYIARALVSDPELLILDEPTSGVDVDAQTGFYQLLKKLNQELKLTLILVSHDIDVVSNQVTTIACINNKLVCHLKPHQFIKKDYLAKVYGQDQEIVAHNHKHA